MTHFLPACCIALACCTHGFGQEKTPARFDDVDTDGNGSIDRAEYRAAADQHALKMRFNQIDTDGDGMITRSEAMVAHEKRMLEEEARTVMERIDANGDGRIDRTEFAATDTGGRSPQSFTTIDTDDDGGIDVDELQALIARRRATNTRNHVPKPGLQPDTFDQPAPDPSPIPAGLPERLLVDEPYDALPGVDPRLLSLDLYAAEGDGPHPIMIMVHGGGWSQGDKTGRGVIAPKASWLSKQGWLFASVNYRLSPAVSHPKHADDVAQSIAWLIEHAERFNGDPDRIFLMGHSAGAHIIAAVACDPRHLERAGLSPSVVKGTIPLDVGAYDMSMRKELSRRGSRTYIAAFGVPDTDAENPWAEASPITHVRKQDAAERIAPFLLVSSTHPTRTFALQNTKAFSGALEKAGVEVTVIAPRKTHAECSRDVGVPDDPLTVSIGAFLDRRLHELDAARGSDADG